MSAPESYRNVFDDQTEFQELNTRVLAAIQEFTEYRNGNVTYGEIMYVLECVLDSLRHTSEKEAQKSAFVRSLGETPTFSHLYALHSRLVERLLKNGQLSTEDEVYVLYGEGGDA